MKIILAGILGGIIMFAWKFVGHDLLPLGHTGVHEIPNEAAVLDAMKSNIGDGHGLYIFPGTGFGDNATSEQEKQAMKELPQKMAANPSGVLIYHPPGRTFSFGKLLGIEFATDLAQAILVIFLLAQTDIRGFGGRVGFVLVAGILAAITTNISYWNWYGFSTRYTAAYMLIEVIGFFLIGLIAAAMVRPRAPQTT
jgi:hypothetical protein